MIEIKDTNLEPKKYKNNRYRCIISALIDDIGKDSLFSFLENIGKDKGLYNFPKFGYHKETILDEFKNLLYKNKLTISKKNDKTDKLISKGKHEIIDEDSLTNFLVEIGKKCFELDKLNEFNYNYIKKKETIKNFTKLLNDQGLIILQRPRKPKIFNT